MCATYNSNSGGSNTLLHTNAHKYATTLHPGIPSGTQQNQQGTKRLLAAIDGLKAQERLLYQKLGTDNYQDFMKVLKGLMNSPDSPFFRTLSGNALNSFLAGLKTQQIFDLKSLRGQDVTLIFHMPTQGINIGMLQSKLGQGITVQAPPNGSTLYIHLQYNRANLQKTFNAVNGTRFHKNAKSFTSIEKFIANSINTGALDIDVNSTPSVPQYQVEFSLDNPFGMYARDIRIAENDPHGTFYNEIVRAVKKIRELLWEQITSSGMGQPSGEFQLAFVQTWDQVLSPRLLSTMTQNNNLKQTIFNDSQLNAAYFFANGKNTKGVKGAIGEFQASMVAKYINIKTKGATNPHGEVGNLIGQVLRSGEQLRSDILAVEQVGVQVKNFDITDNTTHNIQTTTHIPDLKNPFFHTQNFYGFVANYCFNKSFQEIHSQDYQTLIKFLGENFIGEIMNLHIDTNLSVFAGHGLNTLYFVGGEYLIPGSHILEAMLPSTNIDGTTSLDITPDVSLSTNLALQTDKGWNQKGFKKDAKKPLFWEFWRGHAPYWTPTDRNGSYFNELINKKISIYTNFSPNMFLMKDYSIYK